MMITMFEVLQLVETIGKQFPHHHSTNSSRLKWLFRHHPFCYPQIFIFCCGDFPPKQLFYFWKLLLKSRRLCHGGWKSNFHAALRFECWCKNTRLFRTIFKPCELSLFFSFSLQNWSQEGRRKRNCFCLPSGYSFQALLLFVLPLFVEKQQWHFQLPNVVVCYRNAIWSSLLKIQ